MNFNIRKTSFICMIIIIIVLSGCSNSRYKTFEKNFNDSYTKIISKLNDNNISEILKEMKSSENINEVKKMKKLIDGIKSKVPNSELRKFQLYNKEYEGLVLLTKVGDNWDDLSYEDQRKVHSELMLLKVDKGLI